MHFVNSVETRKVQSLFSLLSSVFNFPLILRHFFAVRVPFLATDFVFMTKFDLRREDCVEGMSDLPNEHVNLVVTSPPYNLGVRYGKFSDRQDRQSYLRWCGEWAAQVRRILESNGSFFLNIGSAPSNPMLPH